MLWSTWKGGVTSLRIRSLKPDPYVTAENRNPKSSECRMTTARSDPLCLLLPSQILSRRCNQCVIVQSSFAKIGPDWVITYRTAKRNKSTQATKQPCISKQRFNRRSPGRTLFREYCTRIYTQWRALFHSGGLLGYGQLLCLWLRPL